MAKPSRTHHGDEFGKSSSSRAVIGADAPMIGAASSIIVDGLTQRESGATPPPPPVSIRALAIGMVIMFLAGLVGLIVMLGPALLAHR